MNTNSLIKKSAFFFITSLLLYSCVSVAKLSNLPTTANDVNFDKYSQEYHNNGGPVTKASNEYYFEISKAFSENDFSEIVQNSLIQLGYTIRDVDIENNLVIGRRGLRASELNSVTGVYYKVEMEKQRILVYINTGSGKSWGINRAEKIGLVIKKRTDSI
jgi:hypothetical protein